MEKVERLKQEWAEGVKDLLNRWVSEIQRDMAGGEAGLLAKWELKMRDETRAFVGGIGESLLELVGKGYRGSQIPCSCGGEMKYVGDREVTIHTILGEMRMRRAYYHDSRCGRSQCPLDEAYGIEETKWSPEMRRIISLLGSEGSFESGAELLWAVTGLEVSGKSVERITEKIGRELEGEQRKERGQRQMEAEVGGDITKRVYMEVDGGKVPMREGWREVKLGAIFEGEESERGDIRGETRYFGAVHDELEEFVREWKEEAAGMGVKKREEVIVLADGADWIWNKVSEEFPEAVQILDFYHAVAHAGEVARARWGEGSRQGKEWVAKTKKRLKEGKLGKVINELKRLGRAGRPYSEIANQTAKYYEKNAHRMEYKRYRKAGCFIGSGVVESACKHIANQRLKIAGARWKKDNANDVLRIRIIRANGTWANYWQRYRRSA